MTGFVKPQYPSIIKFHPEGWSWYKIGDLVAAVKKMGSDTTPYLLVQNYGILSKDPGHMTIAMSDGREINTTIEALLEALKKFGAHPELEATVLVPAGWGNRVLEYFDETQVFERRASLFSRAFEFALKSYQEGYVLIPIGEDWQGRDVLDVAQLNIGLQTEMCFQIENRQKVTFELYVDPDRFEVNWVEFGPEFRDTKEDFISRGWIPIVADEMFQGGRQYFLRGIGMK